MNKSLYCKEISSLCMKFSPIGQSQNAEGCANKKTENIILQKNKKISKPIEKSEVKRGRGRPRKTLSKIDSLASIPTHVSISL